MEVIASTIAILQGISSTYNGIQKLKGLPEEFREVNRHLPLAQDTLRLAKEQLEGLTTDQRSKIASQPVLTDCEEKARLLEEIFEKVDKGVKDSGDKSVLDFYRTFLLRLGKANRVETLMGSILKGVNALASNQALRTTTQQQTMKLEAAIKRLSEVKSSIPDSEFETRETYYQSVASGGTGYQNTGDNQKINTGSGPQNNVEGYGHTITFVQNNEYPMMRSRILQTLHTSLYRDRKNRNPDRTPGTCEWFTTHHHFKRWKESSSSHLLWVSANPGCGKSVLAKYLIDVELKAMESMTTSYFFFKNDFEDQKSARSALSCLLHQIFQQREDLFSEKIIQRLDSFKQPLANSYYELWELWDILVMASQDNKAGGIVCVLDAFDECEEQDRQDLANALCKFYDPENNTSNNNLKFIVTSRPYDGIRRGFQPPNIPDLPLIHLAGEGHEELSKITREIDVYLQYSVSRLRASLHLDEHEAQLLLEGLQANPNSTYLWVHLTLNWVEWEISNNINVAEIRRITSSLGRTHNDAYEKILKRSVDPAKARRLLHMVVAAARPLSLAEMDVALTISRDHKSCEDVGSRPEERVGRDIRDLCGLFVNIVDSRVYLIHQTAKEFLVTKGHVDAREGDPGLKRYNPSAERDNQPLWKHSLRPTESHRILCQICIRYLLLEDFETDTFDQDVHKQVFLDYSSTNWSYHFQLSDIKEDTVVEALTRMCDASSGRCKTWFRIHWGHIRSDSFPSKFTTLIVASYFGLEEIVKLQLQQGEVSVNYKDDVYHRTALSWASENGFDNVVKLLIKGRKFQGLSKRNFWNCAKVNARDRHGRTPLSYAAWNGHLAVTRRLVKAGSRIDSNDDNGGTPVSYAFCFGHEHIIRELGKEMNSGSLEEIRTDLLFSATQRGHETIVRRLLENGATVDAVDRRGRNLLRMSLFGRHFGVLKLLLDQGANIEAKDGNDDTLLTSACKLGYQDIIKLLLDRGANIEAKGANGGTLLTAVCKFAQQDIIKLLLDRGANIEAKDGNGDTPLMAAYKFEYRGIVKLLIDRGANIEAKDGNGGTPLMAVCKRGYADQDTVKLLLDRGADIEAKDRNGHTPLIAAVEGRRPEHKAIVKLLLDRGANIEAKDYLGRTPLMAAIEDGGYRGNEKIIKLLLDRGANAEAKDRSNYTPIVAIVKGGHPEYKDIIKLLLDHGANIEAKDAIGNTPLMVIAEGLYPYPYRGNKDYFKLLLDRGANIETKNSRGQTALMLAVINQQESMVRLLLQKGADISAKDNGGRTSRDHAEQMKRGLYGGGSDLFVRLLS